MLTATTTEPTSPQQRYSFGLAAMLLVHLDAHAGQWLSVQDLAVHGMVNATAVRRHLEALLSNGLVRVQRHLDEGQDQGEICEAMAALGEHA